MIKVLTEDWHNVPAGTRLIPLNQFTDFHGNPVFQVKREDGELLPEHFGLATTTRIAGEFLADA